MSRFKELFDENGLPRDPEMGNERVCEILFSEAQSMELVGASMTDATIQELNIAFEANGLHSGTIGCIDYKNNRKP
jgi:hypothetical protein